ncbi:MAG: Hpt domain-containing protein, partial [Pseudomonadota bacterium]
MTTTLRDAIDHTALGWVKPEIDETLRQARIEIEAFAESPADSERMRACAGYLHQVRGTLRMLELHAPAMVAEEMEQLAEGLAADGIAGRDDACAALMRGVVQLPDYLERLQGGHRDIPIVLLPLLNDLRAARGVALMQQDALPSLLVQPSDAELEHARGSLAGRNRALLDTVSVALKEDLLRVKDALDLHLRAGLSDVAGLQSQAEALDRIGETLGMLGLDAARGVIQEQRKVVHGIASGQRPANENDLLDVAGALIYIDHSLDDQVARLGHDDAGASDSDDLVRQESRKVIAVLAREAVANFGEVRNAFVAFVETDWDHAALEPVPRLLGEVSGAMRILQLPEPAGYLEALRRYSQVELIGRQQVPGGRRLDTLADALAGMEYYLESLREPHGQRQDLLDKTRGSLEALAYWPLPESTREQIAADAVDAAEAEAAALQPVVEPLADEPAAAPAVVEMQDNTPALSAGFDSAGEEIDDEIREIFLEEFEEEIANLGELLPTWRRNPDDGEALRPIRRVFHTLKGSGRLVGAKTLGEFSWHVENMLNRVLDGSRPASPAVIGFVGQTCDVLPQLHAALRGEASVNVDLEAMQAVADRLGSGEDVLLDGVPTFAAPPASPEAAKPAPVVQTVATHVDPVLLDILGAEVGGHLETVDAWLAQARAGEASITDGLLRAIHTLNGAFAMTEVPSVTAFTTPAEGYAKRLLAAGTPASADGVAVIGEVAEAVRASTLALHATPSQVPVYAVLAARLIGLRDALPEAALPFPHADLDAERAAAEDAEAARQDAERLAAEAAEAERVAAEAARLAAERDAAEAAEAERLAAEQAHAERLETERVAAEQAEAERLAAAQAEAERLENERIAAEQAEAERVAAEQAELARLEAERISAEHAEAERLAAEEAEAARVEAARIAFEEAEAERLAAEAAEADRLHAEMTAAEQAEAERLAAERAEAARIEGERVAAEVAEAERLAAEQAEAERIEAQRVAAEVAELERLAAEQAESERIEAERMAAEEAEAARLQAERLAAEEAEALRLEAERLAAEQEEADRLVAEAIEAMRLEEERVAAESLAAERLAAEQAEAARIEAERMAVEEAERLEAERVESERIAAARAEAERVEAERLAAARAEAERAEAERRAAEAAAASKAREQTALAALLASATSSEDPDQALDMEGLDAELVDIFVEEGGDLLDHSDGLLAQLRDAPEDREAMVGLQRDLHTLKGGARMAGIMPVGELGHAMETLLEAVVAHRAELGRDGVPLLERGFDRLHGMITRVAARRAVGMPVALIEDFTSRAETPLAFAEAVDDGLAFATPAPQRIELKPLSAPMMGEGFGDDDDIGIRAPQEQVRIRADLLDRLVNYAGEVAIYRSRLEQQLGAFRGAAAEMEQTNIRLRDQLRRLDAETEAQIIARYQREHETSDSTFDPLELDRFSTLQQLSRALAESAADLVSLHGSMDDLTRQYETLL